MNIVLYEPEMPANTGNIGRTCVATDTPLHLIEPLGFLLNDKMVKRSGMDYWDRLKLTRHIDYSEFTAYWDDAASVDPDGPKLWYVTTKAQKCYTDVSYGPDDYLMFGPESRGIPESIMREHPERCIRIPMASGERSLNLSNAVSIVLYEALRQCGFEGLSIKSEDERKITE